MILSLRRWIETLAAPRVVFRTLGDVEILYDREWRPIHHIGNSSVIFRIRIGGKDKALRCWVRGVNRQHMQEIYGADYCPEELYLYDRTHSPSWQDVAITDWIEGDTLHAKIRQAAIAGDKRELEKLSQAFDTLAAAMVTDDRAHGDLKPENIIVDNNGQLHLIDHDATYLPAFKGERSPELGTAAWQHPSRTAEHFDERLDDYSVALISTTLAALAHNPELYLRRKTEDGILFNPATIADDELYHEVMYDFAIRGEALRHYICGLLSSPWLRLWRLPELMPHLASSQATPDDTPEMFRENSHYGFRTDSRVTIPPVYDDAFDFTEGVAAVRLGRVWHYINPTGRSLASFPDILSLKPFRNNRAEIITENGRIPISRKGSGICILK